MMPNNKNQRLLEINLIVQRIVFFQESYPLLFYPIFKTAYVCRPMNTITTT